MAPFKKRGGFFPEYLVYDGGPLDEDGVKDGVVTYTTYWGTGPISVPGIGQHVKNVLGTEVPKGTPEVVYSHIDSKNANSDVASHILLYTYGHRNSATNEIEPISPGAHLHVEPGDQLKLNVVFGYENSDFDIRSLGKQPRLSVGGVGYTQSGAAGSTNVHFHGTNVISDGFGDNVKVEYTEDWEQVIKIPKSHHQGLSWWHPHFHGSANSQVYGGGFGNLSIGDPLDYLPKEFSRARRSYIGIKNFNFDYSQETGRYELLTSPFTPEGTARNLYLLNGEYQPKKTGYKTGEWNAFSLINYSSNSFYNVKIVRPVKGKDFDVDNPNTWKSVDTYLYARDGYQSNSITQTRTGNNNSILNGLQIEDPVNGRFKPLPAPELENNHFLSPAKRQEVLTYFEKPGKYKIISEAWTGAGLRAGGWIWPNIELGTIVVDGEKANAPKRLPNEVTPKKSAPAINDDLSKYEPRQVRRMTWSGNLFVEGANRYAKINGGLYNPKESLPNDKPNRYGGYPTPFLLNDNVLPYNPALITQLDTLEFWDHEQWASEQHPFHPHQNHFQSIDPSITGNTGNLRRVNASPLIEDSSEVNSIILLFMAYLGRFPDPEELRLEADLLAASGSEDSFVERLTQGPYQAEFENFYQKYYDTARDLDLQIADGAYYTITRSNIFNPENTFFWASELKRVGVNNFPQLMLEHFRNGGDFSSSDLDAQARLDNVADIALFAINEIATRDERPLESAATSLLRVLNQQITSENLTNSNLKEVIVDSLGFDHSAQDNGEGFFGADFRQDTIALQSALPKSQSYSLPSSNRYPAPANYNEWEPSRMTTATIYENFTGGYMQHCHILPHEDSGQGILIKTIDNLDRTWTSNRSSFEPGEDVVIQKASDYSEVVLPLSGNIGHELAFGDVNKDGFVDIIVGFGVGGSDLIRVFSGRDLTEMDRFNAFPDEKNWTAGVNLGVGDMTGDALKDIVIGAGEGGNGRISVWSNSKINNGFFHSGDITSFAWDPSLRDKSDTRFTIGDFDTDNFSDIAIVGAQDKGSPIQVISSRNNTTLSAFYPKMKGKIDLSSGFSSWHNIGLETLVMYQKEKRSALMKTATMRAASYVAHSTGDFNPFVDEAKYSAYAADDFQFQISSPLDRLEPIDSGRGFDWLVNDEQSLSDLKKRGGGGDLNLKQAFSGFLANPVTVASVGDATDAYAYLDQHNIYRLPYLSNDSEFISAQKDVIKLFVVEIDRLPTPEELARFSSRLLGVKYGPDVANEPVSTDYIRSVLRFDGDFDPSNPIATDAIIGKFYDHALGAVTYAQAGVVNFGERSSYMNLAEDRGLSDVSQYNSSELSEIAEFGLYALAQIGNSINVDGDIEMYMGPSEKLKGLLSSSYRLIGSGEETVEQSIERLNRDLKGDYIYPGDAKYDGSSPLQNGLNVESESFVDSEYNVLSPEFDDTSTTTFIELGSTHSHHGAHSRSHGEYSDLSGYDSRLSRTGTRQNDRLVPFRPTDSLFASGGLGHDRLSGSSSDDILYGDSDNDQLKGNRGNDQLDGGGGDDLLIGGSGRDLLTGGDGSDSFHILKKDKIGRRHADRISDFNLDGSGLDDQHSDHHHHDVPTEADSVRDKLVFSNSSPLLSGSELPHLHVAQNKKELKSYFDSDHLSVVYHQPSGKVYLNIGFGELDSRQLKSQGLVAILEGSPDLLPSDLVFEG